LVFVFVLILSRRKCGAPVFQSRQSNPFNVTSPSNCRPFLTPIALCYSRWAGAGKTTALRILCGDEQASRGSALICGVDVSSSSQTLASVARRSIGYCPQFDALYEHLTAREHLNFYGAVRGVAAHRLPLMVNALLTNLALDEYADRVAGTYSGGNKRKLSVAIALIGSPPVVFLDEVCCVH
jgi:ABC-type multidrug transport system ATPase subunit